jgi:hypothetical protein
MNPADQRFNDRLFRRIAALEKQLQDIKTAQRIGLDNFVYNFTDPVSASVFLGTSEDQNYRLNFIADNPTLYASELSLSLFINNDLDPDYHWPDGAALTDASGLRPLDQFVWYDLYNSDELGAGRKTYYVRILNWGGIAKTVHMHATMVFPKGNVE